MLTPWQIVTLLAISGEPDTIVRAHVIHALHERGLLLLTPGVRLCDDGALCYDARLHESPITARSFQLTPRGKAMVEALINLPLPQPSATVWEIPGTDFEFAESEL